MKTLMIAGAAACALLALPAMAQAQEVSYYVTGGVTSISIDADDLEADLGAIEGRFGLQLNPHIALEAEAAIGLGEDTVDYLGTDVDLKMTYQYGLMVRVSVPVSKRVELSGRLGYVVTEFEADAGGGSVSDSGGDYAIGMGAEAFITDRASVRLDWTRRGNDASAWSLAYVHRF